MVTVIYFGHIIVWCSSSDRFSKRKSHLSERQLGIETAKYSFVNQSNRRNGKTKPGNLVNNKVDLFQSQTVYEKCKKKVGNAFLNLSLTSIFCLTYLELAWHGVKAVFCQFSWPCPWKQTALPRQRLRERCNWVVWRSRKCTFRGVDDSSMPWTFGLGVFACWLATKLKWSRKRQKYGVESSQERMKWRKEKQRLLRGRTRPMTADCDFRSKKASLWGSMTHADTWQTCFSSTKMSGQRRLLLSLFQGVAWLLQALSDLVSYMSSAGPKHFALWKRCLELSSLRLAISSVHCSTCREKREK